MHRFHRSRFPLLALILITGIWLYPQLQKALKIDNSLTAWFIDSDPALEPYYQLQELFGNDEMVVLVLETENVEDLFQAKLTNLIQDLVGDSNVAEVIHPLVWTLPNPIGFGPAMPFLPQDVDQAKELISENSFIQDQFYTQDFKATRLYLKLSSSPDFEARRADIIKGIYAITAEHWQSEQSHFGGLGVIYEALNHLSAKDFGLFLGLGYILMFLLIAVLYRHWTFTLYAMVTVALSTYFTLALYGAAGFRLNLLSTLIPTIIILLGVMDVMHILNEFRKSNPDHNPTQRAILSLKRIWKPCLFTSLSTMAGFLSLGISPVAIVAEFGIFSALGIAFALFFSFLLGVLFLPISPLPAIEDKTSQKLSLLQDWVIKKQKPIIGILLLFLISAGFSIPKLQVDTDSIGYLPESHPVRTQSNRIEALFGPYMPLDYLIESKDSALGQVEVQEKLYRLEERILKLDPIGAVSGYHDVIAAFQKDPSQAWQVDSGQYLKMSLLLENNPQLQKSFLSPDQNWGRLFLSGKLISASQLAATLDSVALIAERTLGKDLSIKAAGYQSLYAGIVNYVTQTQVRSIALAGLLIFLLLWSFLRSLKLSLISLIPNFFPVLLLFSVMAWFGIALDSATASIASIVLSFSIDDTMHFIWHYQQSRKIGQSPLEARRKTMAHVGRAIVFTSLVLFAGYILMWFGNLRTVVYFGTLTSVSILAALMSQLLIFPILLARWDRNTNETRKEV